MGTLKLVQTEVCSIVYGEIHGKPNQELFRCPRALDNTDLRRYINEKRCVFGMEEDTETQRLKDTSGYLGYYRLYYRNGWCGRWMEMHDDIDRVDCHGVDEIIRWLNTTFPDGCNWQMVDYLKQFTIWGDKNRYLLKPLMSEHYKIMIDTTYGNNDYPVRIYLYR